MSREQEGPKNKPDNYKSAADSREDAPSRREGGDDALSEPNPSDSRMDEKVIVNEQTENKIVNSPSQTEVHPSEAEDTVDEL